MCPDGELHHLSLSLLSLVHAVDAMCVISFPDPRFKSMTKLSWFMNDEPLPASFLRSFRRTVVYDTETEGVNPMDRENEMTRSIRFILNPSHFINGQTKLRCTASSIPPLYARSAEVIARLEPVRGASSPGRYSSGQSFDSHHKHKPHTKTDRNLLSAP